MPLVLAPATRTLSTSLKAVQPNVLYSGPQESTVQWSPLTPPTQIEQMGSYE